MHGDKMLSERLESAELVHWPDCPFPLPSESEQSLLRQQALAHRTTAAVEYHPASDRITGLRSRQDADAVAGILRRFQNGILQCLSAMLPEYAAGWEVGPTCLHPEEEAIRSLGFQHRKDLLHFEQAQHEFSQGRRLLRVLVNLHPTESRVWATSEPFAELLARYQRENRLSDRSIEQWCQSAGWPRLWGAAQRGESAYDRFTKKLDHFLKTDDAFQDRARRRYWHFEPRSAWMVFADALATAELRGQYALEQTLFIPLESLRCPELAPVSMLARESAPARRLAG
ncbi:Kdo hydroxylase family protein [Tuwongella immobilis]|uniref:Uncharacterized protein n=1 Tax=Tuwongella immobilis TaxID=692036 RepID=A0A6C2YS99_9BACT|nr:Kdo hydroxylase family protein [Tuwongella immobilis]VIP04224.1 3-deoxy-D-manno-oct-2-ulosonic acid (Kdo) hydroxylase OS=Chthonomonas calidirosea (strain DSM 23976 / ICMP 18418 / T49) GN=CCALI_01015 PE=4 SV=1: Kdo_hydroxy [Tuwongella immobilis]VTS05812.1 3-deoxy-D-manno-oct-2-ulosonic acid (Kdo) hydroxylase OS=Chthonomonas calidirosea (strain DSM 23976 / ICMP 18418 / T49) GN=CCALI_01015 PE=4 SV=1: Kdo_hydroxy [Tuwongella immobilis]